MQLNFKLSKFQKALCQSVHEIEKRGFNDTVFNDDENSIFAYEKWKLLGKIGVIGLPILEEYDGAEQDLLTTALAIEALAYKCKDEGLVFSVCAHMCTCTMPLQYFGTTEQKKKYLKKLATGEYIGGNGMTEANAGSESPAIITEVKYKNNKYMLNGNKIFVTNAPVADLLIIYGKHPNGIRMLDVSAFIVEKDNNGMKVGTIYNKMGLRTSPLSEITLKDCVIEKNNLLGKEKRGMFIFNKSMLWERILMSAYHVGSMRQQFKFSKEYANSREQFGKKIIKHSNISDKIIKMKMRIESCQLMLYKTCWNYDNGNCQLADASMLKLMTSEAKIKNSIDAFQLFGGYGFIKENMVEKQLRDSMAATIYSGTSEMQKMIIGDRL